MEMHSTIAAWQGDDHLTLYDATQGIFNVRERLATIFGLPEANVRVIDKFVGGGFGSKGSPWSHVALAAMAAKVVGRPVKLVVTRQQMCSLTGHRPVTIQKIQLGCDATGKLTAIEHAVRSETSRFDEFVEPSAMQTRHIYSCPNVVTSHRVVRLDISTPTFTRAPGESSGTYALESAMDELAYAANIDPLNLRLLNYAAIDEQENKPFSSKELRACYQRAASAFGWSKRTMAPRSMHDGNLLVGWGMATATYPAHQLPASCRATRRADGTFLVQAGTQDLGTGTYTIMTQIAADALGVPFDKVTFELGDTVLPETPLSAGSFTAASTGSAVKGACEKLRASGETSVEYRTEVSKNAEKYSMHSHGAVFAEVKVDEDLGLIRVTRLVGAYAGGTVLNAKTARSQLIGGIVYGMGMALLEETHVDGQLGRVVNANLAEYLVPVNADVPAIDTLFVAEADPHVDPLGVKAIGELPMVGAAAAVANAVYHATGRRLRQLPIRIEDVI
jgi:xanthine dehydrogenase YagR molybdenum-binding subunit